MNATLREHQVDLHEVDATCLPFADNTVDFFYSFGVLHHIPEIDQVVAEILRVLKPGGTVMLAVYHKWSVFHLVKVLLLNGLIRGWLFKKGYDGLLATIEIGADGVRIKTYAMGSVESLMKEFEIQNISVHQLHLNHLMPSKVAKYFRFLEWLMHKFESKLGWYVASIAKKR